MSYESKIYVVQRGKFDTNYAQIIASLDLCNMGYASGFYDLFTHKIDYDVYIDDKNKPTKKDCYGDHLKDARLNDVLGWCEKRLNVEDYDYRRFFLLYRLLKAFTVSDEWDINYLRVVHYGH